MLVHTLRRHAMALLHSPLAFSTLKATVALTLMFILIFIRPWASLNPHPVALNGAILVVVSGRPGGNLGNCLQASVLWGGAGLASGVVAYVILAVLCHAPVAQGFVFAVYVYGAALVRAGGAKFISFYLYGVLFAFNGIYTPIISGLRFDRSWFLAVFEAYAWGIAVVVVVNLIFYRSAEHELRNLLITSLQHVSTLAHLTTKTYAKEIDADEIEVRDLLVQTIRRDYLGLITRLEETSLEILYSRWTLQDWKAMIAKVQGLQQALITSSSALELIDALDPDGINVKHHLLRSERARSFIAFRSGIDLTIASIIDVLAPGSASTFPIGEHDLDNAAAPQLSRQQSREKLAKISNISARLKREVQRSEVRQAQSRANSVRATEQERAREQGPEHGRSGNDEVFGSTAMDEEDLEEGRRTPRGMEPINEKGRQEDEVVCEFRKAWDDFAQGQADALVTVIRDGALQVEDVLQIEAGMPSLQTMYAERLPKAWTSSLIASTPLQRLSSRGPAASSKSASTACEPDERMPEEAPCSEALTKSYSLLFGLGQFTEELCGLHSIVKSRTGKHLRFFLFQTFYTTISSVWRPKVDMTLPEALAALRQEVYKAPRASLVARLVTLERWFRSDRSMYAAKVALGATVYTVFLLEPTLRRTVFLRFGMTSSLITIVVAIAPTMGATLTTWFLQFSGTGFGSLYGLVALEIFKNVGGYRYNPFGCAAAVALWAAFSSWGFYKWSKNYTGFLLLMTGAGQMFVLEWLYNELPSVEQAEREPYDTPPQRFAYTLACLSISILISAVFQLLILRTPARRKLRLEIASVTFALSSYNTLLQSNINLVAPADSAPVPPQEALAKVQRELIKRESVIQKKILALMPTFEFAKAEPSFVAPFKGDVLVKIIRSHQIILDRLREARTAVGSEGFNETMHKDFASALFPYRLHSQRLARTLFYLGATSLLSKTQLARDVPSSKPTWASFEHDALVLSRRLSQLPRGEEELRRPGFLRYWFYLTSLGAVAFELEELEKHLGELFGDPDTHPRII